MVAAGSAVEFLFRECRQKECGLKSLGGCPYDVRAYSCYRREKVRERVGSLLVCAMISFDQ